MQQPHLFEGIIFGYGACAERKQKYAIVSVLCVQQSQATALKPSVLLAHELIQNHIPADHVLFALCRGEIMRMRLRSARVYHAGGLSSLGRRITRRNRISTSERSG